MKNNKGMSFIKVIFFIFIILVLTGILIFIINNNSHNLQTSNNTDNNTAGSIAPFLYTYQLSDLKLSHNSMIIKFDIDNTEFNDSFDIDNDFFEYVSGNVIVNNDSIYKQYYDENRIHYNYNTDKWIENFKLEYETKNFKTVKQNNKIFCTLELVFKEDAKEYLTKLFESTYYKLGDIITKDTTTIDENGNYHSINLVLPLELNIDLRHDLHNTFIGVKADKDSYDSGIRITPEQLKIDLPTSTRESSISNNDVQGNIITINEINSAE